MRRKFRFQSREIEKYVYYEWYQEQDDTTSFAITNSDLNINLEVVLDNYGWEFTLDSTLTGGKKYSLLVWAVSSCCGWSFPEVFDGSTAPYPVQNLQFSTIEYDEDFIGKIKMMIFCSRKWQMGRRD